MLTFGRGRVSIVAMMEGSDRNADFLRYYNAAQPLLRGWLLAWLRDFHRAEDLLQETSVVLWKQFGEFRSGESFNAWALGIAKNLTLKSLREARVSPRLADPEVLQAVAATYEKTFANLEGRRRALTGCMDKLSETLRTLVDLYFGQLLPISEIARRTGRSTGGVKVALFRARQWLAGCTQKTMGAEAP
jgi:RNA polymerase sigma-70 factor (ECF subfamily)